MNDCFRSLLVPPGIISCLSSAILLFQSGKRPGVTVFALGVIAFEDGGCAALKSFGGSGCEGAVSRVVGNDRHKGSNGWEALSLSLGQRYLELETGRNSGFVFSGQGGLDATYGSADADNGLHRRPDHDPDEVP